jgi:hypothetical protein
MAIKSQNTRLRVASAAGSAKTITGISKANPGVVTSTAHGLANGDIVVITGVVGMTELNGRAFVVANQAANSFELKGVDTTNYTTWASGGVATPQTMIDVGEVNTVSGFDGAASEIDTTHLRSTAKEFLVGLQDFGNLTLGMNLITDAGQARLRALKAAASIGTFAITLSDGTVAALQALVKSFTLDVGGPDDKVTSQCQLRITGEPAWFA